MASRDSPPPGDRRTKAPVVGPIRVPRPLRWCRRLVVAGDRRVMDQAKDHDAESTRQTGAAPSGWTAVGEVPRTGVLVGAPHTSNWDFVMMLLVMWRGGVNPRVLIKKELFRGPLGWLLPRLGGIPLDRDNPGGVVRELVREARSGEPFLLILAAEGTRKKGEYWKSGFWRIARSAKLPIALAFIDGPSRAPRGSGPRSWRRPTSSPTWTRSASSTATSGASTPSCAPSRGCARSWRPGAAAADPADRDAAVPTPEAVARRRRQPCGRRGLQVDDELGLGALAHLVLGDAGCELAQDEAGVGDVEDGEVGDDALHDAAAGVGQRALLDDLVGAVLGVVLHEHDDPLGAVDEVHGAAHALDHLAGDHPVGDVAGLPRPAWRRGWRRRPCRRGSSRTRWRSRRRRRPCAASRSPCRR